MAQKAGPICGNPLCGLKERVCINVRKVYDGCITRFQDRILTLALTDLQGTAPYTYVEARSNGASVISKTVITPLGNNRNRIQMDVTQTSVTLQRDIILDLPNDSLSAYSLEAFTNIVSTIGEISGSTATIRCCIVQITRVIVNVDILVPSYGYCEYPPCSEYSDEICEGLFNLPVFPTNT